MDKYTALGISGDTFVSRGFLQKTNTEFHEWCETMYNEESLEKHKRDLPSLWAWQEQEKRKTDEIETLVENQKQSENKLNDDLEEAKETINKLKSEIKRMVALPQATDAARCVAYGLRVDELLKENAELKENRVRYEKHEVTHHLLSSPTIVDIGPIDGTDEALKNLIKIEDTRIIGEAIIRTEGKPLCEDEGCPHSGTDHICLDKDDMVDIKIEVVGPGTTFTYEMIVIQRALEAAGIRVIVKDDYPLDISEISEENFLKLQYQKYTNDNWVLDNFPEMSELSSVKENPSLLGGRLQRTVELVAKHYPWGG